MKPLHVFDAEAARTLAYGFFAASLFGDFPLALRILYIPCGLGVYMLARWLLRSGD